MSNKDLDSGDIANLSREYTNGIIISHQLSTRTVSHLVLYNLLFVVEVMPTQPCTVSLYQQSAGGRDWALSSTLSGDHVTTREDIMLNHGSKYTLPSRIDGKITVLHYIS